MNLADESQALLRQRGAEGTNTVRGQGAQAHPLSSTTRGGRWRNRGNQVQQNIESMHILRRSVDVSELLFAVKRIVPQVPAPPS